MIMAAVQDHNHLPRLFFLNAPGGYGKTFLIEALLSTVRGMGKIALAVASSGIAAELLEGGRMPTQDSRYQYLLMRALCVIYLHSQMMQSCFSRHH